MAVERHNDSQLSDVKAAFAWGQLFIGSLFGGLAFWKLLHKLTHTEPSAWFRGVSAAYEEIRNFLMLPFDWIHFDFNAAEKNVLAICIVLGGALIRSSAGRTPDAIGFRLGTLFLLLISEAIVVLGPYGNSQVESVTSWLTASIGIRAFVLCLASVLAFASIVTPLFFVRNVSEEQIARDRRYYGEWWGSMMDARLKRSTFILLNIVFTSGWGIVLLLTNWGSS